MTPARRAAWTSAIDIPDQPFRQRRGHPRGGPILLGDPARSTSRSPRSPRSTGATSRTAAAPAQVRASRPVRIAAAFRCRACLSMTADWSIPHTWAVGKAASTYDRPTPGPGPISTMRPPRADSLAASRSTTHSFRHSLPRAIRRPAIQPSTPRGCPNCRVNAVVTPDAATVGRHRFNPSITVPPAMTILSSPCGHQFPGGTQRQRLN